MAYVIVLRGKWQSVSGSRNFLEQRAFVTPTGRERKLTSGKGPAYTPATSGRNCGIVVRNEWSAHLETVRHRPDLKPVWPQFLQVLLGGGA